MTTLIDKVREAQRAIDDAPMDISAVYALWDLSADIRAALEAAEELAAALQAEVDGDAMMHCVKTLNALARYRAATGETT